MEQEKQNLLEMIDRPAFLVCSGIITQVNELAKHRLIQVGAPIRELILHHWDTYEAFQEGCLYLTIHIGTIPCGATVTRQPDGDVFLLDRDFDQYQLQALALAAQQLRIPLSNVMPVADCLFPNLADGSAEKEQAAQITRGLFQLMRLISIMSDAERYSSLQEPRMENTELNSFIREIFEKADTVLDITGVKIRYTGLDKGVFSLIERECLERAVYNLLSNAVKFAPKDSFIQASLTRSGNLLRLTIEDQGDGIASHVQGSLFHRYLREPAIEDSRFGLGLGMTLVRSAAALHEGTVLVDHSGGTRVTLTITIRKTIPGMLHSPALRIGDYTGGRDIGLLEFSELLPPTEYDQV